MQVFYQQMSALSRVTRIHAIKPNLLTKRELQVLELISHGNSTRDICEQLFLSKSTIETHRCNLLQKMDCKNVAQLVRRGFEVGILLGGYSKKSLSK